MRKLPNKNDMKKMEGSPEEEASESPAKEASEQKAKKMSPVLQVMKAVTDHALKPKKKNVKKNVKTKGERQEPGDRANKGTESAQGND